MNLTTRRPCTPGRHGARPPRVGYAVTGSGCACFDLGQHHRGSCNAATGTIEYYTDGGTNGLAQASYTLAIRTWVSGPSDIAVAEFPAPDHPGGQQADGPNVYEFAVPLNPSCTVTSITFSMWATRSRRPSAWGLPRTCRRCMSSAWHCATRPPPTPRRGNHRRWGGRHRVADVASGTGMDGRVRVADRGRVLPTGRGHLGNQTVRIAVSPNVSVPAGAEIRIRLSNPGFWSTDDAGPRRGSAW